MAERTVSTRHIRRVVTTNANTAEGSPLTTSWSLGIVILESVEIMIPPGHAGLTGIALSYASTRILPWDDAAAWIVGDGYVRTFDVDLQLSAALSIVTFNTDDYAHSHHLIATVRDLPQLATAPTARLIEV